MISIHIARLQAVGQHVRVAGVVTAEAGRLGDPDLIVIQDADAGIVVRLPDGAVPPARNARLTVTGVLAAPYGQLEIRPAASADLASPATRHRPNRSEPRRSTKRPRRSW